MDLWNRNDRSTNWATTTALGSKQVNVDWWLQKNLGAQQLLGDEGSYLPNGKLLCLWDAKAIEAVQNGH